MLQEGCYVVWAVPRAVLCHGLSPCPGEITRTLSLIYPGVLLAAVCGMFKDFLVLMTLGGGHRTTFEGSLCAGLPPSCQKVSAFVFRVSKRSRIWGPIRKDGAEDCCNENIRLLSPH